MKTYPQWLKKFVLEKIVLETVRVGEVRGWSCGVEEVRVGEDRGRCWGSDRLRRQSVPVQLRRSVVRSVGGRRRTDLRASGADLRAFIKIPGYRTLYPPQPNPPVCRFQTRNPTTGDMVDDVVEEKVENTGGQNPGEVALLMNARRHAARKTAPRTGLRNSMWWCLCVEPTPTKTRPCASAAPTGRARRTAAACQVWLRSYTKPHSRLRLIPKQSAAASQRIC